MSHPATPSRFIGCDVGKTAIVVFDTASGRTYAVANTPEALSGFAASLEATCFVVCEATGLPSRRPQGQGLHPLVWNAGQIRRHRRKRAGPIRARPLRRTSALERPRARARALASARPGQTRPRQGSPRLRQSSRRPRRRARPPLSPGARRKLRGANQRDRGRHQDLVRRV
jgi:hypothetical protein